ncbi:MAG: hypothetical protein KF784_07805 [Fimbriimonadaceae bacterium]|nr:hypothetical protein [Fimbriimonadaceae bacterium]
MRRSVLLAGVGTVGAVCLSGWIQTYPGASVYSPDPSIELKGTRRTSAEHDAIYPKTTFPYVLDLSQGKGRLLFIGVQHTSDPANPQFKNIEALWNEMKPDVALVESRLRAFSGSLEDAVKRGEPYYIYGLAHRSGVPIYSLEPDAKAEGAALAKTETPERALMWITLRGYLSDRRNAGDKGVSDTIVGFMLSRRASEYGIQSGLKTLKDLDELWKKDFPDGPDWRKMDERMMWPGDEKTYLNRLANVANEVRDDHWARVMVDLVRKGKKVFAVGGASHTIIMEPVLRLTLTG